MTRVEDLDDGPVEQSGWARLGHLLVHLSVVAATAVALTDADLSLGSRVTVGALAVTLLAWHALMAYRWRYWELPRWPFLGVMAVAAALWVPLMVLHDGFEITIIAAYAVVACPFLGRAAASLAGLTAIFLVLASVDSGGLTLREVSGIVLTGLALLVVHGLIGRIHRQNVRQRALIDELTSTRTELARREREAGVLSERERLARDIHDSLAQGFTSIIMLLEAADARLDSDAVEARARINQARQAARGNLAEARRVVWSLRPGPLQSGALPSALHVLVDSTFAPLDTETHFRIEGDPFPLPPEQEVTLYRAAQEALANAAKHADARRVVCTLTYLTDEVILDVNDNGCGFDPGCVEPRPHGGLGLAGLRERVAVAGGSLQIESSRDGGTNVTVGVRVVGAEDRPQADARS